MSNKTTEDTVKVQFILDGADAQIYELLKKKKAFFTAMMNMAYNDAVYNEMFFIKDINAPTPKNTVSRMLHGAVAEQSNQNFDKKKKVHAESWA